MDKLELKISDCISLKTRDAIVKLKRLFGFKKVAMLIISLFSAVACDSFYEAPEVVYLIKKGEHFSNVQNSLPGNGVRSLKSSVMEFTARFDESAIYDLGNNDQKDVNKLFGFSDCNSQHQDNSARFGWNYNLDTQMVDIFAYAYISGKRVMEKLGSSAINETNLYRLRLDGEYFQFEYGDNIFRLKRENQCSVGLYYLLYPYFGGDEEAPHDIRIYIMEHLNSST